jgi:hypothetical protein
MRFSIVYDDNGTILSASEGDDVTDLPVPGPGENVADLDIPDDLPDAGRLKPSSACSSTWTRGSSHGVRLKGGLTMVRI